MYSLLVLPYPPAYVEWIFSQVSLAKTKQTNGFHYDVAGTEGLLKIEKNINSKDDKCLETTKELAENVRKKKFEDWIHRPQWWDEDHDRKP